MTMDMKRTKKIAACFLIILSLFVSSVAVCVCSHHAESRETGSVSCHEHEQAKAETVSAATNNAGLDSGDECGCISPAPRAFSKSETLKIEKQAAALSAPTPELKPLAAVLRAENHYFEKPFYLSDSFSNLKSPRAPPVA